MIAIADLHRSEILDTLRISDVTFQRLIYILELLEERSVIVPSHRIVRHLQAKEHDAGYLFNVGPLIPLISLIPAT